MIAIYKKEMRAYLTHMMGYVFLAFMLLVVGIGFTLGNVFGMNANFQAALQSATMFFFILIPVLTMRLFSEEARQRTDQLIFTSPLSVLSIVLGKFLAAFSLFMLSLAVTIVMPIMLSRFGEVPVSHVAGTYIGFALIGAACIAVGVFISVLTDNQIIAAVVTIGAVFVMFIMSTVAAIMPTTTVASFVFVLLIIMAVVGIWYNATRKIIATVIVALVAIAIAAGLYMFNNLIYDGIIVRALLWFSVFERFSSFSRGILNISDIVYYLSFSALFLYLTVNVIEKRRWR
ncbi:MAG: ABC transporter permease [Defluviitaleaceae bacterium]|nr:ABC transporter permease [Defluviitaleaceae bacterium]